MASYAMIAMHYLLKSVALNGNTVVLILYIGYHFKFWCLCNDYNAQIVEDNGFGAYVMIAMHNFKIRVIFHRTVIIVWSGGFLMVMKSADNEMDLIHVLCQNELILFTS